MLPRVIATSAIAVDAALIGIFAVFFPALVTGLIVFAIAQGLGERKHNLELRNRRQGSSRG